MLVIGIAGGIASGKSLVANFFRQLGAVVLDADAIGHQVLREPGVKRRVREIWGDRVFDQGEVDRSALARIVFDPVTGPAHLRQLEEITHPRIGERIAEEIAAMPDQVPALVLDAPVMIKAGWDRFCDKIVFVHADREIRQQRVQQRGWSAEELDRREARQTSLEAKRQRATDVVDNSTSTEATRLQVRRLWQRWRLPLPQSATPTNLND